MGNTIVDRELEVLLTLPNYDSDSSDCEEVHEETSSTVVVMTSLISLHELGGPHPEFCEYISTPLSTSSTTLAAMHYDTKQTYGNNHRTLSVEVSHTLRVWSESNHKVTSQDREFWQRLVKRTLKSGLIMFKETESEKVVNYHPTQEEKLSREQEEKQRKRDLEKKRQEAYERRAKLKEQSEEESLSEVSESRYEMGRSKINCVVFCGYSPVLEQFPFRDKCLINFILLSFPDPTVASKSSKHNKKREKSAETTSSKLTTVGRQTNNSLSAADGQILIQPVTNSNKKKLKTSQVTGNSVNMEKSFTKAYAIKWCNADKRFLSPSHYKEGKQHVRFDVINKREI
ncbi:hypothetical protein NQ317_009624 [Molorchus minor]|uniref:Uncharacterized protein n=1 Tax=Molorchus minor TaxID=1323400 RepID=A0ABQ9JK26_9CUCU|nr:hypothetical protein NQ317_009624 [Molorchus minor]